jgi:hypothetical protein
MACRRGWAPATADLSSLLHALLLLLLLLLPQGNQQGI